MVHGVGDAAYAWIMHYAEVAPAFVAARAGYDVWLGNSRGNTFSRKHTSLDPEKDAKQYWDFDWQEMGSGDLPAFIDYILDDTEQEKLAYIGHSQGTSQMFYALSENESYFKDKLSLYVALGPVTKIPHEQTKAIKLAADIYDTVATAANLFGVHDVLDSSWFSSEATKLFCTDGPLRDFCNYMAEAFISGDPKADDPERLTVKNAHGPYGTPLKSLLHYAQNIREDRFQVWADDYSHWFNIGEKKQTDLIPLENIKDIPTALFAGKADKLADVEDAQWVRDTIGDAVVHYQEIEGGHISFMIGKDMSYFTNDVMGLLQQYHPLPQVESAVFLQ